MYTVHVTSRSGGDGEARSSDVPDSEIVYKQRKKDSIPLRVFNFIKQRFNPQPEPEQDVEDLGGVLGGSGTLGFGLLRHRPEDLTTLSAKTRFTRKEIQMIYRGFKQECPTGYVDEDAFKHIFSQFFPQGDASQYAHYVFNTIKHKQTSGKINFEEFLTILSNISRGTVEDKLQWVFGLYDLDGDGMISRHEMIDVVGSIYEMLGRYTTPHIAEPQQAAREHVDRIFHLIDANKDGFVTIDELVQWCSKDEHLLRSFDTLDTVL
ncbi:Kv channel-interacting protein 1-like isoform X2 [Phymastichus coffea]|uniref:Kv channel-interacting protein 1-like isoform X2 n=1 Tax=Phymastichus coffea TaxID=108790 RepID=UPI00273CE2C7|nr:Kv channel-interacting protein 1-like isoform X2 [Phymastichus coffea]